MFGLEKLCLLNKTWIYPCNPSLHLHGQIGAACGKNSCLFSEIDKSIQITERKSQLKMTGKIHSVSLSLTPVTSPSNEFQLLFPCAASFSCHHQCCSWNRHQSQHLQNVSPVSSCLSHGDVKEQSLWKLLLISLLKTVSSEVFLCQWIQLTDFRIALACQGRSALCHKNKTAWNLFLCTHSSQSHALHLELALMLVPSPLGAPKANEPLASLISSWDWRFSREDHCSFKGIVCFRKSLRLNEFCSWWIRCPVSKQNIKCKCSELTFHSFFTYGLWSESS